MSEPTRNGLKSNGFCGFKELLKPVKKPSVGKILLYKDVSVKDLGFTGSERQKLVILEERRAKAMSVDNFLDRYNYVLH